MFCKVMEDESLCKAFLEILLTGKVGKITYLSSQNAVTTNSEAKSIRLDVLVKDETGKSYDIEMSFSDRHPCLSENTSFAIRQNIAAAWNHRHPWRNRYGKKSLPIKVKK